VIQRAFQTNLEQQFANRIAHRPVDETAESIKRAARTMIDRRISLDGYVARKDVEHMAQTIHTVLSEANTNLSIDEITTIINEIAFERTGTAPTADDTLDAEAAELYKKKGCQLQ
jgi:hypothetical protein